MGADTAPAYKHPDEAHQHGIEVSRAGLVNNTNRAGDKAHPFISKTRPHSLLDSTTSIHRFALDGFEAARFANMCGQYNEHLRLIERQLGVNIRNRGEQFELLGDKETIHKTEAFLRNLYREAKERELGPDDVHLLLQESRMHPPPSVPAQEAATRNGVVLRTRKKTIRPRGRNQQGYVRSIQQHDINFGVGPAGTGKTYLAVACAVDALERGTIERILLVRPAVEAGEKLGFLPGDLSQKIDPYLRPLYDALYEMLGTDYVNRLIERQVIEVAPLAYMRGRTLNNSFIILDESQNTTRAQMKMFLTRIGFGSTAVITGDITQIDLPRGSQSGLKHVLHVLQDVKGLGFTFFDSTDVVRHPLVQLIVEAYDAFDLQQQADSPDEPAT